MGKRCGRVALVGAGPGDPGLLTLKGKRLLQSADVVVHDRLIPPELLELAPGAEKIDVGKCSGSHPVPQEEINRILSRQAEQGRLVVRLKGGDPYLFGRGGEEAEWLRQRDIPFQVVPGIPSALAALNYAGVPATHRGTASSLHILTGHGGEDAPPGLDFEALGRVGGTLVFLMAVAALERICAGLLQAGMSPSTPAVIVENGTLAHQRKVTGSLKDIAAKARQGGVGSPALLAVGPACAASSRLDWFGQLPLSGRSVVVTRPKDRAASLCRGLGELGARVLSLPCVAVERLEDAPLRHHIAAVGQYSWLALTSPQGVRSLFRTLGEMALDARALAPARIAAIGPGTAAQLADCGIRADYIPQRHDAAHLAGGLIQRMGAGERLLLLRAQNGTPDLPALLEAHRVPFDDVALYRTVPRTDWDRETLEALAGVAIDWVAFTSPSTVEGFAAAARAAGVSPRSAVCIGDTTAAAAKERGYRVFTARSATVQSMIETILEEEEA